MRGGDVDRRQVLKFGVAAVASLLGTKVSKNSWVVLGEEARLPDGARQFSSIVSAQRQWDTLLNAFAEGRMPEEKEWDNIRGYLRAVYRIGDDMDFLTKGWGGDRRKEGAQLIGRFRKAVRDLDKPAASKDAPAFLDGHSKVVSLFNDFFNQLKSDSAGDVPSEL